ncbi:G8 domain-containing protein [Granulosicoccus sp.]|nr:G8 domain-containing protein [Granulosicoccus sp.]
MRLIKKSTIFLSFSAPVFVLSLFFFSTSALAAQITLSDSRWALLTIPANAEGQTIESLFADDLPIESLGTSWRIFRYDSASQSHSLVSASDTLGSAEGFWMQQRTGADVTIDIPDTLPSGNTVTSDACVSPAGCFLLNLPKSSDERSLVIVGAPFNQPITVSDIRLRSNETLCEAGCTLKEAVDAGFLSSGMWTYDSGSTTYVALSDLAQLQTWHAFRVSTEPTPASIELALLLPSPETHHVINEPESDPGPFIETHHESISNPVHGSTFRVSSSCKAASSNCQWNDPDTWLAGTIPDESSLVILDGQVTISSENAVARSVGVYPAGRLMFSANDNTRLRTADLVVLDNGVLEIGTENTPIGSAYTAELVFRDLPFDTADTEQHLRGLVALDGTVRVYGHKYDNAFIRTANEPEQGDTTIMLSSSAASAGWRTGDAVVIPTSSQCAVSADLCPDQTEDRTIESISVDGLTMTLDRALQYDHFGARSHSGSLDFTPHFINKSRNVIFRSENPEGIRAHFLFHGRADVDIRYTSVRSLGRTDIRNLGPENQKGRYPVHAHHLIGPVAAQPNGYQFTYIGNVVDFGEENREQDRKWGIVIHGSHYGLIEQNVVDHASGAAIVTESGSEMGNMFRENFVVRVVGGNGARLEDKDPNDRTKLGRAGTGYWFNGGGRNFFEQNIVAAIAECVYCFGYKFDNVYNDDLLFPLTQGSDPHMAGGELVSPYSIGLNNFVDNEAYAVPNGMTVWWECTLDFIYNDDCSSRIDGFKVWNHYRWGYFGYPVNNMTLSNFVIRGNSDNLTNVYYSVTGLTFADYMQRNLVIENADIQNMRTAIQLSSTRHELGATGPDVGINTIKDSYLVATAGIGVWAPASVSVNGGSNHSPQTTIVQNVQFDYPAIDLSAASRGHLNFGHILMHDTSQVSDPDKMNRNLRNDVWVYNYNSAPGVDGDNFYIIPTYQGPSRCNDDIAQCASEVTGSFTDIDRGHVYPLR